MKTRAREQHARARLPILIRYRAQDYETRYLDDPRTLYVEEFQAQHPDDGFFAIIPAETTELASAKKNAPRLWLTLAGAAMTFGPLGWVAYRLFSIF